MFNQVNRQKKTGGEIRSTEFGIDLEAFNVAGLCVKPVER